MKLKLLGVFAVIALLWAGGQGVYEAVKNPSPQVLTCAAAQSQPLYAGWLQLSGCKVNLLEAAFKARGGAPDGAIYLPLVPAGPSSGPVRLVVATRDPDIVAVVKEMQSLGEKNETSVFAYLANNTARVLRGKDVKGMVQSGIDSNDRIRRRLKELNKDLADDFVVIDEGREPGLLRSALFLTGGLGVIALIAIGRTKKQAAGGARVPARTS